MRPLNTIGLQNTSQEGSSRALRAEEAAVGPLSAHSRLARQADVSSHRVATPNSSSGLRLRLAPTGPGFEHPRGGDAEPMVGFAVQLRALAEVPVCAPPDFAERLARIGMPMLATGPQARPLVHGATSPSAADLPRRAGELAAAQFDTVTAAAEGCEALVATGVMPDEVGLRPTMRW